jgi:hypothetical protein
VTNPLVLGLGKFLKNNNSLILRLGINFKTIGSSVNGVGFIWFQFQGEIKFELLFETFLRSTLRLELSFKFLPLKLHLNFSSSLVIGTCFPLGSQSSMILTLIYNSLPWFFLVVLIYFNFGGWHGFNSLINVHGVFINLI